MEVERKILVPEEADEVWESLTDPERLEEWFASDVELDARPGGEGIFRWGDGDERRAVVRELEEEERLVLDWDDGGSVAIELETSRRHARARRRDVAGLRPRSGAARLRVDGSRGVDRVFAALGDPGRRSLVETVAARGTRRRPSSLQSSPSRGKPSRSSSQRSPTRVAPRDARGTRDALRGDTGAARGRRRMDGLGRRAWDERLAALRRSLGLRERAAPAASRRTDRARSGSGRGGGCRGAARTPRRSARARSRPTSAGAVPVRRSRPRRAARRAAGAIGERLALA